MENFFLMGKGPSDEVNPVRTQIVVPERKVVDRKLLLGTFEVYGKGNAEARGSK